MSNKRRKWLKNIKHNAESKKITTAIALEGLEGKKSRHPFWWMLLGLVTTIFISVFFDTVQENRLLRAELRQIATPFKEAVFTKAVNNSSFCQKENNYDSKLLELPPSLEKSQTEESLSPNLDYELIKL